MPHTERMGCREDILATVRILVADRPDGVFSAGEVVRAMRAHHAYSAATIATFLSAFMRVGAPPAQHRQYADLERVSRGRYRLINADDPPS